MKKSFRLLYPLFLFLIIVFMYAVTLRGVPGNPTPRQIIGGLDQPGLPFESSLARGRFAQTMAIADDGTFDLRNGKELIPMPDLGFYDGRFYSLFPPGISILSVPIYEIGKQLGASQITVFAFWSFIAALNSILIYLLARSLRASRLASFLAGLSYSVGTTAWPYAISLAQHNATVFLLLTILLAGRYAKRWPLLYLIGGLAYGLATFVDYVNAMLLLPAVMYLVSSGFIVKRTESIRTIKLRLGLVYGMIGILAFVGVHAAYNKVNFGSPIVIGTSVFKGVKTEKDLDSFRASTPEDTTQDEVNPIRLDRFFDVKNLINGVFVLLLSRGRGIFLYAPVVLFGVIGLFKFPSRYKAFTIAAASTLVVNLMMYSSFSDPWGGWEFGPRYLIPSMSVLAVCLATFIDWNRTLWLRFFLWLVFIYSTGVNLLGALTTNKLPSEIEAVILRLPYTYTYNFQLLTEGKSYGVFFSSFVSNYMFALEYGVILMGLLALLSYALIFVMPTLADRRRK